MNDDAPPKTPIAVPASVTFSAGIAVIAVIGIVCVGFVLVVAAGLVWSTRALEGWLEAPPQSVLIAALGVSIVVTVLIAQARIVTALREIGWGPLAPLRDQLHRAVDDADDWDDDGDDEPEPPSGRGR